MIKDGVGASTLPTQKDITSSISTSEYKSVVIKYNPDGTTHTTVVITW